MRDVIILISSLLLVAACDDSRSVVQPPSAEPEVADQEISYDPSTCKTDAQGMVYFALGREVFRKPFEESMFIFSLSPQDRATLPARPDPSEPPGCPDNPLAGTSFSLMYQHQPANPQQYPPGTSFRAQSLELIGVAERLKGTPVEFGLQPLLEGDYQRVKSQYNRCELLANGLNACRVPEAERSIEYWAVNFQANPSFYDVPYGRLFTVSCSNWSFMDRQDCRASYNYSEDTRIDYTFEIHDIPPLEIIEFDKGVRALVEAMRIQNYRWQDQ